MFGFHMKLVDGWGRHGHNLEELLFMGYPLVMTNIAIENGHL
jgi:hypothetical protein